MKKLTNYAFVALLAFAVFNIFFKNTAEADPKQSYARHLAGKALFIDVREDEEVKEGMIKGALWIPLSRIEGNRKSELAKIKEMTKGKEIYIYCRSGNRANRVKDYLQKEGIKSANMGSFSNLVKESLPTQLGPQ